MAGIVKSTKRRYLIGKRIKEVDVAGTELDTDIFFQDLAGIGGANAPAVISAELNRLPSIVKNEAVIALVPFSRNEGQLRGINGDTKSIEFFPFTRGSSGSVFDSSGNLTLEPADITRLGHRSDNGQRIGYIIEAAATNIRLNSGFKFVGGSWTGGFDYVDTGWNRGSLLSKGAQATNSQNIWYNGSDIIEGKIYTLSCYVKMSDGAVPVVGANAGNDFALILANIPLVPDVEPVGNGIYRLSITARVPANTPNKTTGIYRAFGGGSSAKTVVATAFQLEEGTNATSYIPTTDAAATRLADKLTSNRPIAVYPKNSLYMESDKYTGWFGDGVEELTIPGRNLMRNSISPVFTSHSGTVQTVTHNVFVPEWNAIDATRVQTTGGSSVTKVVYNSVPALPQGEVRTLSGWFKNNGSKPITVFSNYGQSEVLAPSQSKRIVFAGMVSNGTSFFQFQLIAETIADNLDFTFWRAKLEKGLTATDWTPAPEDLVRIDASGNLTIESNGSDHIRSLSLVPRALTQEEI